MTLFRSSPFFCISREAVSVGVLKPPFELNHFRPKRVLEASPGVVLVGCPKSFASVILQQLPRCGVLGT